MPLARWQKRPFRRAYSPGQQRSRFPRGPAPSYFRRRRFGASGIDGPGSGATTPPVAAASSVGGGSPRRPGRPAPLSAEACPAGAGPHPDDQSPSVTARARRSDRTGRCSGSIRTWLSLRRPIRRASSVPQCTRAPAAAHAGRASGVRCAPPGPRLQLADQPRGPPRGSEGVANDPRARVEGGGDALLARSEGTQTGRAAMCNRCRVAAACDAGFPHTARGQCVAPRVHSAYHINR